ncbi:tetraspanin [Echinococcus multilocularis]|uniref:Tetraspanin n=1 Tax=Echinococcus multilocularis TaxID=6211 RepID=A0A068YFT0_ECHMU|nr:tetraspanin [Echinococcus multilocularis]
MSCAVKFMKFILFSLNLLFVLIGLALVVAGAWAVFNIPSFVQALAFAFDTDVTGSELYQNAKLTQAIAYVCIGLGLFIFLVSFFGCCGVVTDSCCLLITYAVVVSLLFLAKVICVLVFLLLGEKISPIVIDKIQDGFSANYKGYLGLPHQDDSTSYSQTMDTIMLNFQCCGVYGPQDFEQVRTSALWHEVGRLYVNAESREITGDAVGLPVACCQFRNIDFPMNSTFYQLHRSMKNTQCPVKPVSAYNTMGCVERISSTLKQYTVAIAVAPVIIAVIEVIGVILASALAHEVKQDVGRLYY